MKRKLFLLFIALALYAGAQTMTGLPQRGVTLSGDIQHPAITNGSDKEILALNLDFTLLSHIQNPTTKPPGPLVTEYFIHVVGDTVHLKETRNMHGAPAAVRSGELITGVVLDSVVFADGSCVGPDRRHGCKDMAEYFAAMAQVASPLLVSGDQTAAWAKIQQLASPSARRAPAGIDPDVYGAQRDAARALLAPHMAGKNEEAQKLAESLASLPVLRKVN